MCIRDSNTRALSTKATYLIILCHNEFMKYNTSEISNILHNGDTITKISILSSMSETTDLVIIREIISMLDDKEKRVRGEAFSTLFLNDNNISDILISNLTNKSKNIRGFCALILANKQETNSINSLINLTKDTSAIVRSCAFGALGHLRAKTASKEIHLGIFDSNVEVKKSASYALILINEEFLDGEIIELEKQEDPEFRKILKKIVK